MTLRFWVGLTLALLVGANSVLNAQTTAGPLPPTPQTRSLGEAEIIRIMASVREAMIGKTTRATPLTSHHGGPVETMLIGPQGRPQFVMISDSKPGQQDDDAWLTHYAGIPARTCEGKLLDGELVLNYHWSPSEKGWVFDTAREREFAEPDTDFTDMFNANVTGGDMVQVGSRRTYRMVSRWINKRLIIGEQAKDVMQVLWIDADTLLPEASDLSQNGKPLDLGWTFVWDPSLLSNRPTPNTTLFSCVRQ